MSIIDDYYPTIDTESLCKLIESTGKVHEREVVGSSVIYTLIGPAHWRKKNIVLRSNDEIKFFRATGIAIKLKFMNKLTEWYKEHKNWNEG